jgi:hypothetical protein
LIDLFTLALTHGLIVLALWRLMFRPELDVEDASEGQRRPWLKENASAAEQDPSDA